DDPVVSTEVAALDRRSKSPERDSGGGFPEDSRRRGEERHVWADLLLRYGVDRSRARTGRLDGEVAVGRAPDRQRARERRGPDRRDTPPLGERRGNRREALGLAAEQARGPAVDEAELEQLAEPDPDAGEERARGDGRKDRVGKPPAELPGDLVGERLGSLRVVGAQADVHEGPVELEGELDRQAAAGVGGPANRLGPRAGARR